MKTPSTKSKFDCNAKLGMDSVPRSSYNGVVRPNRPPTYQTAKSLMLVINLNAGHARQSGFPFRIRDFPPLLSSRFSFIIVILYANLNKVYED